MHRLVPSTLLFLSTLACSGDSKTPADTANGSVNEPEDSTINEPSDSSEPSDETGVVDTGEPADTDAVNVDECVERQEAILPWFTGQSTEVTGAIWFGHTRDRIQ